MVNWQTLSPSTLRFFTTFGAANCGIDNSSTYCVFRGEIPPSCEDIVQEEGRAVRRTGTNPVTDSYTICILLELLLKLWRRIYAGTVDKLSHRKSFCMMLRSC